jgi:hypothetical protein
MQIQGTRGQQCRDFSYRADGSVTGASTPVLVLPEAKSRSFLFIQNISSGGMYVEFGAARATATLTLGLVTGFSITNDGFGYTLPPTIELFGGGNGGNSAFLGVGMIGYPSPNRPAKGHVILDGLGGIASITIDDPGAGYLVAPYVQIKNSILDPYGCADPSENSGSGLFLGAGQSYNINGTACTTDAVAVYGSGSGTQNFTCMYMP